MALACLLTHSHYLTDYSLSLENLSLPFWGHLNTYTRRLSPKVCFTFSHSLLSCPFVDLPLRCATLCHYTLCNPFLTSSALCPRSTSFSFSCRHLGIDLNRLSLTLSFFFSFFPLPFSFFFPPLFHAPSMFTA